MCALLLAVPIAEPTPPRSPQVAPRADMSAQGVLSLSLSPRLHKQTQINAAAGPTPRLPASGRRRRDKATHDLGLSSLSGAVWCGAPPPTTTTTAAEPLRKSPQRAEDTETATGNTHVLRHRFINCADLSLSLSPFLTPSPPVVQV